MRTAEKEAKKVENRLRSEARRDEQLRKMAIAKAESQRLADIEARKQTMGMHGQDWRERVKNKQE